MALQLFRLGGGMDCWNSLQRDNSCKLNLRNSYFFIFFKSNLYPLVIFWWSKSNIWKRGALVHRGFLLLCLSMLPFTKSFRGPGLWSHLLPLSFAGLELTQHQAYPPHLGQLWISAARWCTIFVSIRARVSAQTPALC